MLASLVRSIVGLVVCAPVAFAQCAEWSRGFSSPVPGPTADVMCAVSFDDGSGPALYVGGRFTAVDDLAANRLARWDGTRWSALEAPDNSSVFAVTALTVFDDGSGPALYEGRTYHDYLWYVGASAGRIAKWEHGAWSLVGGSGTVTDGSVLAFATFDDGTGPALYVAGDFTLAGSVAARGIAKWDGTSWSALGTGLDGPVYALQVFDDGSGPALYAGGAFTTAGGVVVARIARWNGSTWSRVGGPGAGANETVRALAVFDAGSGPVLIAGGDFSFVAGTAAAHLARWNGTSWSSFGAGIPGDTNAVSRLFVHDDGQQRRLFVSLTPRYGYTTSAASVAEWNGTGWSPIVTPQGTVSGYDMTFATCDDGTARSLFLGHRQPSWEFPLSSAGPYATLYDGVSLRVAGHSAGGGFDAGWVRSLGSFDDGSGPVLCAGGPFTSSVASVVNGLACRRNGAWQPLANSLTGYGYGAYVFQQAQVSGASVLHVGGSFDTLYDVAADNIATWNGTTWSPLGAGTDEPVLALAEFDDGTGPALYAGGDFSRAGTVAAEGIARWDGSAWSALGPVTALDYPRVAALAAFDDGSGPALFAAGRFTSLGGVPGNNILKWQGGAWHPLANGLPDEVCCLAVHDDGSGAALYVGGAFTSASGVPASFIAKWDGLNWSPLGSGLDAIPLAFATFDDGSGSALFVGGAFRNAGGTPAAYLAKWNGAAWSPVGLQGGGMGGGTVQALVAFDDGSGPALYAGGSFRSAGNSASSFVAKLSCSGVFTSFCAGDGSLTDHTTPCPCANDGAPGHGCAHSFDPRGAELVATGITSNDTVELYSRFEPAASFTLFLQHTARGDYTFHDGVLCAGGSLIRLRGRRATAGTASFPETAFAQDSTTTLSIRGAVTVGSGVRRYYSAWYRNASSTFCPPATANVTNGWMIDW